MKINEVIFRETATAGATSSGNIASVVSPHIAIGKDRGNKSYTGTPGMSGTKAPRLPKIVQPKNPDGTAKGAQTGKLTGVNLMGGPLLRRQNVCVKIVVAKVIVAKCVKEKKNTTQLMVANNTKQKYVKNADVRIVNEIPRI